MLVCSSEKYAIIVAILVFSIAVFIIVLNTIKKKKENLDVNLIKLFGQSILSIIASICAYFATFNLIELIYSGVSEIVKPIIYIYPEKTADVKIKLGFPKKLTCTYPEYSNCWNVKAFPDGKLIDAQGKEYYALYWEGKDFSKQSFDEGFVIEGNSTAEFLEEKLAFLGLNDREANEFIIYWLPILKANKYNLIRFQTIDEIERNMPLEIYPQPDTVIRVMIEFKPLKKPISVKEQKLKAVTRKGYTVVEWGGIKNK